MSKSTKTAAEKIAAKDERIQQLINEKKRLIQQEKAKERKERNNRLYRRHGLLEKYMPELAIISDEHFEMFIKRAIDTGYGQKILAEYTTLAGESANYVYIETSDDANAEDGASTPKAEPSGS